MCTLIHLFSQLQLLLLILVIYNYHIQFAAQSVSQSFEKHVRLFDLMRIKCENPPTITHPDEFYVREIPFQEEPAVAAHHVVLNASYAVSRICH